MASRPAPFSLRTTVRDGLAVVAVAGELDCATAPRLSTVLDGLAEPGRVILVDLSDTEFMDCAGVGALARSYEHQCQLGGELLLDSPPRAVCRVLERTHLDKMITILHGVVGPAAVPWSDTHGGTSSSAFLGSDSCFALCALAEGSRWDL
jgi:anti-sigma B factor antagonist